MQYHVSTLNGCLVVRLEGEIDEYAALRLRPALDRLFLDQESLRKVLFDVSGVTFMDSTGIGLMIGRYKQLKVRNVPVFILNPSPTADRIFTMARLYEIMPKADIPVKEQSL